MRIELTAEQALVRDTVGPESFLRGREYLLAGRVGALAWSADGRVGHAKVAGTSRASYVTTVTVRTDGPHWVAVSGVCTCPVSVSCKHVAAVLLRALDDATPTGTAPRRADSDAVGGRVGWQTALDALSSRVATASSEPPTVGLQFDVRAVTGHPLNSLVLRPVVPGRHGGWVRSGVSWNNLAAVRYRGADAARRVRLLGELVTAARADESQSRYYYAYREPTIALEGIATRRIWDLFDELDAVGVPLVSAGREAAPVHLHAHPARLTLDLHAHTAGVEVAPRLLLDDERLPHEQALLVGGPAHGVAWLIDGQLHLARLASVAGVDAAALLGEPAITVPTTERDEFLARYVPGLQRLAEVRSTDESVVVPEPEPPVLALRVEHRPGHRIELGWDWIHVLGPVQRREPLWPAVRSAAVGRSQEIEQRLVGAAEVAARPLPELFDDGRLAAQRHLDGMATVAFLRDVLPAVERIDGLAVTVVGDPVDYHEVVEAPSVEFVGLGEERDWFDLRVDVSVAGENVPFVALFGALARDEQFVILPSGAYFALDRPEFAQLVALIAESRALLDAPPGTVRVGRLQAGVWDQLERIGVVTAQADAWRALARELAAADHIDEYPVPSGLQAELRPYQVEGFTWLAFLFEHGLGGVLADEMGLGKTLQTLALVCHVYEKGLHTAPFLVVAPTSVVHNWAAEAARFAPHLAVRTITETGRRRGVPVAQVAAEADIVVTSYTLFRLEHDQYADLEWAGLVLDEAQVVKNHQSVGYGCAKSLDVGFKLAVTGTPLENTLMELWSLLSITAPGLFPHPRRFEQYYRLPVERDHDSARLDQLRTRIRPLLMRRTKQQVVTDLPAKQEQVLELDLNPKHRRVYQTLLQRERQKVLGLLGDIEKNRFAIFRSLTLLRQACLDVGLVDDAHAGVASTKLDVLLDHLVELAAEGHTSVVFSQFTRFLSLARARLDAAGIDYCYLDGRTRKRTEVIERFKSGGAPVFLISLKAGGVGLNLTEADYCFLLDPWWNPATEAQAVDRLHRIGQRRSVMVYRLVARETIEEKVMALKAGKAALFDSVLDAKGVTSGKLSAADIRGLIT